MSILPYSLALTTWLVFGSMIQAEPEPRSTELLWTLSDAVVVTKITEITNVGPHPERGTLRFKATFQVQEVCKGEIKPGGSFIWNFDSPCLADTGTEGLFRPGQKFKLFLIKRNLGEYSTFGSDCYETLNVHDSQLGVFPIETNQTSIAPQEGTSVSSGKSICDLPRSSQAKWKHRWRVPRSKFCPRTCVNGPKCEFNCGPR